MNYGAWPQRDDDEADWDLEDQSHTVGAGSREPLFQPARLNPEHRYEFPQETAREGFFGVSTAEYQYGQEQQLESPGYEDGKFPSPLSFFVRS